jgi:hypothetical protein
MIAFLFSPIGRWMIGGLAAFALLASAYAYVDHKGYQRAAGVYEQRIAADAAKRLEADLNEQRRQIIANNAAKKREAEAIAALEAEEARNLELRKELRREAEQDPDRDRVVLGAPSVRRINKIR